MTNKQRMEFAKAAEPLIKWLVENVDQRHKVIVTHTKAKLFEYEALILEYVRE